MPATSSTTDWITAIATVLGVCVALGAAIFVFIQVLDARNTLYSSNSYTVQKDIASANDRVWEAQDNLIAHANDQTQLPVLSEALVRQATHLDTSIESVTALSNNGGIKEETLKSILARTCTEFKKKNYIFVSVTMSAIRDACQKHPEWETALR